MYIAPMPPGQQFDPRKQTYAYLTHLCTCFASGVVHQSSMPQMCFVLYRFWCAIFEQGVPTRLY